jgi:flavodoxin
MMRALVVYTSWFGHTRLMARAIAEELEAHGITVVTTPIDKIEPGEVLGYGMLLLGTHSHTGHAPRPLRDLCAAIPYRRLCRMAIGVFGTKDRPDQSGGLDDIVGCLQERGCPPVLQPLWIERVGSAMVLPEQQLSAAERDEVRQYVAELAEICLPVAFT